MGGAHVHALPVGPEGGDLQGYLDTVAECDRLFVWEERTQRLGAAAIKGASNASGQVSLELDSQGDRAAPWLLVVSRPGFDTHWEVLPREKLESGQIVVRLQSEPACRVQVLRDGRPAAGAVVELQALLEEDWIPAMLGLEQRSRRALRHLAEADEDGIATLPKIRGRCRVAAKQGEWASLPWVGEAPASDSLELAPTFGVSGSVRRQDGAPLNEWAHVCLSAWDEQRLAWVPCMTVFPEGRGEFAGLLAATGAERYRVQAVLTGARDAYQDFAAPSPGALLELDLELGPEAALWLTAVDATGPDKDTAAEPESIPGAVFDITWQGFGGQPQRIRARAGGNGYAWVRELPPGAQFWFSATAPGYGRESFGPYTLPEDEAAVLMSPLQPSSDQRARVTLAGKPVREFLLRTYRSGQPELCAFEAVRADANGEFCIPKGPAPLQVQAWLPNQGASGWVDLPGFTEGDPQLEDALLELKIDAFAVVSGRVVSEVTGGPIADAVVGWRDARSRSGPGFQLPVSARADSEGRFRIAGANASMESELIVRAPGHQALIVEGLGPSQSDLGDLKLGAANQVDLVLAESNQSDWVDLDVVGRGFVEEGVRRFDGEGVLRWTHDLGLFQFEVRLGGSNGGVYPRDISGKITPRGGRQAIAYFPPSGASIQLMCRDLPPEVGDSDVVVSFEPLAADHPFSREVLVPQGVGQASLPRLEPGTYSVKLSRAGHGPFARDQVEVTAETQELVVSGRAGRWDFRIRRSDGGPVGNATIYVSGGTQAATAQTRTGDGGWAGVASIQLPQCISGRFEDGAVFSQVPIQWEGDSQASGRVSIGELRSIPIQVEGHGGSAAPSELRISDPRVGVELARVRTDGSGLGRTPPLALGDFVVTPVSDQLWPTRCSFDGSEPEWRVHVPGYGQIEARLLGADGEPLANQAVQVRHAALGTGSAEWIAAGLFSKEDFVTSSEGILSLPGAPAGWIEVSTAGQQGLLRVWVEAGETHREDLDWRR